MSPTITQPPSLPARARTIAYVVGIVLGVGVGPALLAAGQPVAAAVCAPLAGAANVIAYAYRPTRPPEGWTGGGGDTTGGTRGVGS